jgi:endonuclease YncB( thermonuclease family)
MRGRAVATVGSTEAEQMTGRVSLFSSALLVFASVSFAQGHFTAKVTGVADGDTISVMHASRPVTIRIQGIDCPEDGQDFSARAKQFTSSKVFGKTVSIEPRNIDRYGRTVARVVVDGEDLGLALVKAGLAWHYKQYSNDNDLARAENAARETRVGLWSHPKPIPPWEYRRPTPIADASGPFHGNASSRVFHRPGCPHYDCQNCIEVFKTRELAVAAGFRPAGDCLR